MAERSRQGLDRLLAVHPEAEVACVSHQAREIVEARWKAIHPFERVGVEPGPWTCVDLFEDGELLCFAIWNLTGQVYALDQHGAVGVDPVC